MGNCCRRESAMVWATVDDCWDAATETEYLAGNVSGAPDASTLLRIKITKKGLEELASLQDVPVDRVLSRLINAVDYSHDQRQRSWSPSLHSIAE